MSSKTKTTATKEAATPAVVPKLRFPEFRRAEGWKCESMSKVYSFKGNNSLSRDKLNYVSGSVKNIHYGDIHTKFSTHFDITKELVPFINDSELGSIRDENFCTEGDIVFADASEDLDDIGKSIEIVNLNNERVVSGTHTILARQTGDHLVLGFGGHLFKSGWVRAQIQKESQGSKVLGISPTRLRDTPLPFPPEKEEQQKIAECLSSVDELIAAQARKLDALKTHKKGLMQQLFPREGETQPRLRFPEFQNAGEWVEKSLGQLIEIASGQVDPKLPPYCDSLQIGSENIESNSGKLVNVKSAGEKGVISGNYAFDENDILYSKIRPALNKVAAPSFKGICSADIYPIRPASGSLLRGYLFYLLLSQDFLDHAIRNSERGKIPKINRDALDCYKALIPSPVEQQRIATCLSSLDALITAETQKHEALKTHKKGLMQQLFPSPEEPNS